MKRPVNSRVLELKKELALTDIEFCGRASISTSTLNKIKNDEEVSQKVLVSIINAFGVGKDWLIAGKGKMFAPVQQSQITDPWRDAAFSALREEVMFYRDLLKQMAGGKTNFLQALNVSGLPHKRRQLSAAAA